MDLCKFLCELRDRYDTNSARSSVTSRSELSTAKETIWSPPGFVRYQQIRILTGEH